jgi:hypothetical protein
MQHPVDEKYLKLVGTRQQVILIYKRRVSCTWYKDKWMYLFDTLTENDGERNTFKIFSNEDEHSPKKLWINPKTKKQEETDRGYVLTPGEIYIVSMYIKRHVSRYPNPGNKFSGSEVDKYDVIYHIQSDGIANKIIQL